MTIARPATIPYDPDAVVVDYDAVLVVSFGGPEGMDDVMPFLENVTRGRDVPRERLLEVAEHYEHFDGVSPINAQNRALARAVEQELEAHGPALPVYVGNRNWHPLLPDTLRRMADDGVERAAAFVASAYSCYSCCRQYRQDIERARGEVGEPAPTVDKLRVFYNHPGFVEPNADNVRQALGRIPEPRREMARLLFTAHSVPLSMARASRYEEQLEETSRLVAKGAGVEPERWELVYQSRSGPPHVPWLEPDVLDRLDELADRGVRDVVLAPIGFLSDHMEVLFDLDVEALERCEELGIHMERAATVGTDPAFVSMIRELVVERMTDREERRTVGRFGPGHDVCPPDCCLPGGPEGRPLHGSGKGHG